MKLQSGSNTQIRGSWPILARTGWVSVALVAVSIFIAAFRVRFPDLSNSHFVNEEYGLALNRLDLSVEFLAFYITIIEGVFGVIYLIVGVIIFLHKSNDWMVIFFSATLLAFSVSITDIATTLREAQTSLYILVNINAGDSFQLNRYLLLYFP